MNGVFIRMPQYKFPKLADSRDFEYLILDCYKALYPKANVYMYGRQGQKQYGFDFLVQMSAAQWCIQCKNYEAVSVAQIDTWIEDCTYYDKHPFQKLIIASAAPEDTKIADHLLYDVKKPFQVEYVSWERICGYIESFPSIFQAYYGNLEAKNTFKKDFLAITAKYYIRDFLRLNPINEGMHINLPECLDNCHTALQRFLDLNADKTHSLLYEKIEFFMNLLEEYSGYLSTIMFPVLYSKDSAYLQYRPFPEIRDCLRKKEEPIVYKYRCDLSALLDEITDIVQK